MSLSVVSRTALLTAVGWAALAGTAAAQSAPRPAELDEVIVTGMPFGVTDRASLLAVEVLDEADLAVAPASTLGDLVNGMGDCFEFCPFEKIENHFVSQSADAGLVVCVFAVVHLFETQRPRPVLQGRLANRIQNCTSAASRIKHSSYRVES
jgi:hypothetical protein